MLVWPGYFRISLQMYIYTFGITASVSYVVGVFTAVFIWNVSGFF